MKLKYIADKDRKQVNKASMVPRVNMLQDQPKRDNLQNTTIGHI